VFAKRKAGLETLPVPGNVYNKLTTGPNANASVNRGAIAKIMKILSCQGSLVASVILLMAGGNSFGTT